MTRPVRTVLLVGGARSGKSRLAVDLAHTWAQPVTFVATATAGDADMAERIARHQAERPSSWATVEQPKKLVDAIARADPGHGLVIDCITLWATNEMLAGRSHAEIDDDADRLAGELNDRSGPSVVVTNEVGSGIVPATESGRAFRDVLGTVNRTLAERLDATYLVVAGRVTEMGRPRDVIEGLRPT